MYCKKILYNMYSREKKIQGYEKLLSKYTINDNNFFIIKI